MRYNTCYGILSSFIIACVPCLAPSLASAECLSVIVGLETVFPHSTDATLTDQTGAAAGYQQVGRIKTLLPGGKLAFTNVQGTTPTFQTEGIVTDVSVSGRAKGVPNGITVTGTISIPVNGEQTQFTEVIKATKLKVVKRKHKKVLTGYIQSFFYVESTGALYLKSPKHPLSTGNAVQYQWQVNPTCPGGGGGGGGKK